MSNPATLNIDRIVDVAIYISPLGAPRRGFNEGLILGSSSRISPATRLKIYSQSFATEMIGDGFVITDPEYIAVQLYFSQTAKGPAPNYVWVGQQYLGALKTVIPHSTNKGSGYQVGDVLTVVQTGAALGTVQVATIGDGGSVESVTLVSGGWKYTVATGLSVTGGHGTAAQVDISEIGETLLQALTACRIANYEWYGAYLIGAAKADIEACAAYIESATPTSRIFANTSDAETLTADSGSVGVALTALSYKRWNVIYSTTQGGTYPNNIYSGAAELGIAMGLMTGLNNCAFTLNNCTMIGITPEPLDDTAVRNLLGANIDCYLDFASYYKIILQGTGGKPFYDEGMFLDWFANQVQLNMMDLYYAALKVSQTDPGVTQEMQRVINTCKQSVDMGFVAQGQWNGSPIMNLNTGDYLPKGFLVQAPSMASQAQADRDARKSVPIYVALKLAGAIHSITIGVYVNR